MLRDARESHVRADRQCRCRFTVPSHTRCVAVADVAPCDQAGRGGVAPFHITYVHALPAHVVQRVNCCANGRCCFPLVSLAPFPGAAWHDHSAHRGQDPWLPGTASRHLVTVLRLVPAAVGRSHNHPARLAWPRRPAHVHSDGGSAGVWRGCRRRGHHGQLWLCAAGSPRTRLVVPCQWQTALASRVHGKRPTRPSTAAGTPSSSARCWHAAETGRERLGECRPAQQPPLARQRSQHRNGGQCCA